MSKDFHNLTILDVYKDPQEYYFNSDLVEFTEFGVQLKDLVNPDIVTACTFCQYTTANYANKEIFNAAYTEGSITIENHRLSLTGGLYPKAWVLPVKSELDFAEELPKGEIYFTYNPNYSNAPVASQDIFALCDDNQDQGLFIRHCVSGDIKVTLVEKNGLKLEKPLAFLPKLALDNISFTISWKTETQDLPQNTKTTIRVFMNGQSFALFEIDSLDSFDLNAMKRIQFGSNFKGRRPNFGIKNLVIFSKAPHVDTESFEDKEYHLYGVPEYRYTLAPQKIEPIGHIDVEDLIRIVPITRESVEDDKNFYIGYTFKFNDKEYFFDRSTLTWKESFAPEQIGDLGYMMAYKDVILENHKGQQFKCIPYLRTIKGDKTPAITSMSITYNKYACCIQEKIPTATIYGYVTNSAGDPIRGAKIIVSASKSSIKNYGNTIITTIDKVVRSGDNGYWDVTLPISLDENKELLYNIQILYRDEIVYQRANIKIKGEGTIRFSDLIDQQEI